MLRESQPLPLPFKEIKEGSPESSIRYRRLTPDALKQLKGKLGKPVEVVFVNESWIYQGPDEEDYSESETHAHGTLINVDERTIEIEIIADETKSDYGAVIELEKTRMEFPFSQKEFNLRRTANVSQIRTLTVGDKIYQLGGNPSDREKREEPDASVKVRMLINNYGIYQEMLNSEIHLESRHNMNRHLERVKSKISQLISELGHEGLIIFNTEIRKKELEDEIERKKQEDEHRGLAHLLSPTDHWTSAARSNQSSSMAEYYENEGRATANTGYRLVESPMGSLRRFLQLIEKNAPKPTKQ